MPGRKEMFYLMTHSTHFIYCYIVSYMIIIWQRTTQIWAIFFFINNKGSFICTTPQTRHHRQEQEIAQWAHNDGSIWRPIASWVDALLHTKPHTDTHLHIHSFSFTHTHTHTKLSENYYVSLFFSHLSRTSRIQWPDAHDHWFSFSSHQIITT